MGQRTLTETTHNDQSGSMSLSRRAFLMTTICVTLSFALVKLVIRPLVLNNTAQEFMHIFVLSYPNFCEAILGSFLIAYGLSYVNLVYVEKNYRISERAITFSSLFLAVIYTITQEVKIHNLGGRNVYDPYDVLFTVAGLLVSYWLLWYFLLPEPA